MPSMSDLPPAGNMPSGNSYNTEVDNASIDMPSFLPSICANLGTIMFFYYIPDISYEKIKIIS